jgi:hypothetical protein
MTARDKHPWPAKRAAREVQQQPQVAGGCVTIEIGPELLDEFFTMQRLAGSQREELDDAARLATLPGRLRQLVTIDRHAKPAEQRDHNPWSSGILTHHRVTLAGGGAGRVYRRVRCQAGQNDSPLLVAMVPTKPVTGNKDTVLRERTSKVYALSLDKDGGLASMGAKSQYTASVSQRS